PLAVDRDVALEEMEALVGHEVGNAIRGHVHAEDFPVRLREDALREVMADEAVHAEDQDLFHKGCGPGPKCWRRARASLGWPSRVSSRIRSCPPPAQSTSAMPLWMESLAVDAPPRSSRTRVRRMPRRRPLNSVNAPG